MRRMSRPPRVATTKVCSLSNEVFTAVLVGSLLYYSDDEGVAFSCVPIEDLMDVALGKTVECYTYDPKSGGALHYVRRCDSDACITSVGCQDFSVSTLEIMYSVLKGAAR